MIDIHDIPKEKPSKYESQQKLRKYKLKSILGLFAMARAIATRWFCPPDNSKGDW